jgi:penicillin-binding protein 2
MHHVCTNKDHELQYKSIILSTMNTSQLDAWTIEDKDDSFERPETTHQDGNTWKMLYFKVGMVAVLAVTILSLFNLQIVNGAKYKQQSNQNRIYIEPVIAPRGIIYDRNGVPLVYNQDTFNAVLDSNAFDPTKEGAVLADLSNILQMSQKSLEQLYTNGIKQNESFITIAQNISQQQVISITTDPVLKSIQTVPSIIRVYPFQNYTSHLLGYVGPVAGADVEQNPQLNNEDTIGKDGIEYQYDNLLRGVDGENIVERNAQGDIVSVIKQQSPIAGSNIYLSIDINIQKKLEDDLAQGVADSTAVGGAAIIQDIHDGSILALDSYPSYDNNEFAQGITQQQYDALLNNSNKPLIDRAISDAQQPGSVMKTITASAALQEGAITPSTIFYAGGTFNYGGHVFQDFDQIKRGNLDVVGGLQWSSNIFFYNTILALGIDKFSKYEKLFGVGSPTGIDLPGEVPGEIADPQVKQELTGQVWYGGDSLLSAIGEEYVLVTPIQVINWITSIANNGTLYKPQLLMKVQNNTGTVIPAKHTVTRQNFVSQTNLAIVRNGMHQAACCGIDDTVHTPVVDVAVKTGTAEFGQVNAQGQYTTQHAWITGFAPYTNPQISFVIFLESGGLSTHAELVAKSFLNWYYGGYSKDNPIP